MLKILSQLNLTRLFILAILIRLLIMPFYFHPDIKTYHFQASFLKNGTFNIYTFLANNKQSLPLKEEFVYFPLTYFFLGTYQILMAQLLGPNFSTWVSDASVQAIDRIGVFRYLFVLKFPYLILDLAIPFLLIRFFEDIQKRRAVFILWLFNPISIAVIYFFSNIDIIPVTLFLMSILLFRSKKILLSGLILGIAAGFKAYPLILLPFLLLFTNKFKVIAQMLIVSMGTLIVVIAPFWSNAFFNSALVSGLTTRIAFPSISLGFGESLMVALVGLSSLFLIGLTEENIKIDKIWLYILLVLLTLFSGIHYHIQWLLWIMPFLVILYVFQKNLGKIGFVWLALAFIIPILYDDKSMNISLLSAISPFYNLLPTPFLILQRIYDPLLLQGIIHSLMFGISLVMILRSFKYLKYE